MFSLISQPTYHDSWVIVQEGSWSADLYLILAGTVELSRMFRGEKVVIETLKQGDLFGEPDFMGNRKYSARATATARGEVVLGLIDQRPLIRAFTKQPDPLKTAICALTDRANQLIKLAGEMSSRANPRIPRALAVSFRKGDQTTVKAYAGDISLGGLFIKTDDLLERGSRLPVNLHVPGLPDPLKLTCEVVQVRKEKKESATKAGMGVKFIDIPEKDEQILQLYLKTIEQMKIESSPMSEKDARILEEYLSMIESVSSSV